MIRLVLFDIDGTLVHTGRAGSRAFGKTLASEFNAPESVEKVRFGGRTDPSLARELFGLNGIPPTPENFRRFFESYVFWLDHLVANSNGEICRGVPGFHPRFARSAKSADARLAHRQHPARRGNQAAPLRAMGTFSRPADLPTTAKTATTSPPPRSNADDACSAEICAAQKSWWSATRRTTCAADNSSARKFWPWPPAARRWRNCKTTSPIGRWQI